MALFGFGKKKKQVKPIVQSVKVDIEDFWNESNNKKQSEIQKPKKPEDIDIQSVVLGMEKLEEEIKMKESQKPFVNKISIITETDMEKAVLEFERNINLNQKADTYKNIVSCDEIDDEILHQGLIRLEQDLIAKEAKSPLANQIDDIPVSNLETATSEFEQVVAAIETKHSKTKYGNIDSVDFNEIDVKVEELTNEYSYLTTAENEPQYDFECQKEVVNLT